MAGNLLYWMGIGAAQKSAASKEAKPIRRPHWAISIVAGFLLALSIAGGLLFLLKVQQ
jgi:hypothetical protein